MLILVDGEDGDDGAVNKARSKSERCYTMEARGVLMVKKPVSGGPFIITRNGRGGQRRYRKACRPARMPDTRALGMSLAWWGG